MVGDLILWHLSLTLILASETHAKRYEENLQPLSFRYQQYKGQHYVKTLLCQVLCTESVPQISLVETLGAVKD